MELNTEFDGLICFSLSTTRAKGDYIERVEDAMMMKGKLDE